MTLQIKSWKTKKRVRRRLRDTLSFLIPSSKILRCNTKFWLILTKILCFNAKFCVMLYHKILQYKTTFCVKTQNFRRGNKKRTCENLFTSLSHILCFLRPQIFKHLSPVSTNSSLFHYSHQRYAKLYLVR